MATYKDFYDSYHRPQQRRFQLVHFRAPRVYELLSRAIEPGAKVLDIGCGDGHALGPWAKERGCRYVGVDIAPSAVEQAREAGYEAHLIDDSSNLPFGSNMFDAVTCLEVVEHLWDPRATLAEAMRVLRPGGVLCVSTPNVAYWRRRVDMALLGRWNPFGYSLAVSEPWGDPHIRFFNPGSLSRLFRRVGAEGVRVAGTGGGFLLDLPWLGRRLRARGHHASVPYRGLQAMAPSMFGCFMLATGRKPEAGI
jgi:methionine biosynthesis protein MetW